MANRWERGKLGPYTMPRDFTTGGVALEGINNIKNPVQKFLLPAGSIFYAIQPTSFANKDDYKYVISSGQDISRSNYSKLFNVIGTSYGSGDGSTTFSLPYTERIHVRVQGTAAASGVYQFQSSVIPQHTHTMLRISGVAPNSPGNFTTLDIPRLPASSWTLADSIVRRNNLNKTGCSQGGAGGFTYNQAGAQTTYHYRLYIVNTNDNIEVPIGGIIPFIGSDSESALGSNWLLCNGQTVPGATYPNAAANSVTATPDLRGQFITGSHSNTQALAGQTVPYHSHYQTTSGNFLLQPPEPSGQYLYGFSPGTGGSCCAGAYMDDVATTSVGFGPATETRPANMNVNYFMRVN